MWALCVKEEAAPVGQFPRAGHVAILLLSHEQLVRTHPSLFNWKHTPVCLTSSPTHRPAFTSLPFSLQPSDKALKKLCFLENPGIN